MLLLLLLLHDFARNWLRLLPLPAEEVADVLGSGVPPPLGRRSKLLAPAFIFVCCVKSEALRNSSLDVCSAQLDHQVLAFITLMAPHALASQLLANVSLATYDDKL